MSGVSTKIIWVSAKNLHTSPSPGTQGVQLSNCHAAECLQEAEANTLMWLTPGYFNNFTQGEWSDTMIMIAEGGMMIEE